MRGAKELAWLESTYNHRTLKQDHCAMYHSQADCIHKQKKLNNPSKLPLKA
jgi:hypothetical protein